MFKGKKMKVLLATSITLSALNVYATSFLGDKVSAKTETIKDKKAEKVEDENIAKIQEDIDEKGDKINKSLRKLEEYKNKLEELNYDRENLSKELSSIEDKKVKLEDTIKDKEDEVEEFNNQLIKLAEEKVELEKEKEDKIDQLNGRVKTFFKNSKNSELLTVLGEGKTINESLENNAKMGKISESDVLIIEDVIKTIEDIKEKEDDINKKVDDLNKVLDDLHIKYEELEDLEIKKKVLENELNIKLSNVEALIKSEEISVKTLRESIKGLDVSEQNYYDTVNYGVQLESLKNYREYQKQLRENVRDVEDRIKKDTDKLEELLEREKESESILGKYRDSVYDLKDVVKLDKRETALDKKQDVIRDLDKELSENKGKTKKEREERKELRKELQEAKDSYAEGVLSFGRKEVDKINNKKFNKKTKSMKVRELRSISSDYRTSALTSYEKELKNKLIDRISESKKELGVFTGDGIVTPTTGTLTYGFGARQLLAGETHHYGIDIANREGTPIVSVLEGTVVRSGYVSEGYGNYVFIEHKVGDKIITTGYGHMSKRNVKVGDKVGKGEVIGLMGTTGWSTGDHLHFEVYLGKKEGWSYKNIIDPYDFLKTKNFSKFRVINAEKE